jgi:rubrerythrin
LKLSHDNHFSAAFEMHQQLAQICRTQNQHAKRVEKILEKQFAPYKKEAGNSDPQKICEFFEGKEETENTFKDVPISALIWFAARKGNGGKNNGGEENKSKEIETRIFTAVHLKEHQALRFYDELSRKLPGGKAEDVMEELRITIESNEKLQRNYKRLE